ncbi:phosphopantetheine adenylyltransferase-like isoform X1 [Hibiscus syriacus]|uniref:Phosphopantetheine adenylyltransferase-like isoform X1 n=1 Tax=Hibiscus syriacus TaxID=106335 RepID=A0A6A2Y9I0_HIBSY|nr:phosphopantetheine adenylyltransferase-like isoform X1 [Hibiscus syriacus]
MIKRKRIYGLTKKSEAWSWPLFSVHLQQFLVSTRLGFITRFEYENLCLGSVEGNVVDKESAGTSEKIDYGVVGMHHVGILCENLERSLEFYQNVLGLEINAARPHDKLPYRGAWLWVGSEMIHLMELPNPDPLTGRPEHGGRDRHACISIRDVSKLHAILDKAGIPSTLSRSRRPAIFTKDSDANALEFT